MAYEAETESGEFVWIDLKVHIVHTQLFTTILSKQQVSTNSMCRNNGK